MLSLSIIISVISITLIILVIINNRKNKRLNIWIHDITALDTCYNLGIDRIKKSNDRITTLENAKEKETNPERRARYEKILDKQYIRGELLCIEHNMNHYSSQKAINYKYTN